MPRKGGIRKPRGPLHYRVSGDAHRWFPDARRDYILMHVKIIFAKFAPSLINFQSWPILDEALNSSFLSLSQ